MIGVKATRYDGTPVTAYANKGVILATGGYAANIDMVLDTNVYWSSEYLTEATKTPTAPPSPAAALIWLSKWARLPRAWASPS